MHDIINYNVKYSSSKTSYKFQIVVCLYCDKNWKMASAESEKTPLLLPDSSKPKRNRTVSEIIRQQRNERPSSVSGASTDDGEIGPSVRRERTFSASETEYECDDIPGWEGSCFCHPQALLHRIIALILMCLLGRVVDGILWMEKIGELHFKDRRPTTTSINC